MIDRIGQSLLGNPIQVDTHNIIAIQDGLGTVEPAINNRSFLRAPAQFPQGIRQISCIQMDGGQTAGEFPGVRDGITHHARNFPHARSVSRGEC